MKFRKYSELNKIFEDYFSIILILSIILIYSYSFNYLNQNFYILKIDKTNGIVSMFIDVYRS